MESEGFFIHQFELGPMENYVYLIGDRRSRECAVVDPAWNYEIIMREAEALDLKIRHLLCTHSHFDHVNEVESLLAHVDAQVHMLRQEIDFADFKCENLVPHSAGDVLAIGAHCEITMMHTPGHTPGSTCYHVHDRIVTGDTMFVNGCGRCDILGGDPDVMYRTLWDLVNKLPGDTVMFPGHNYGPTATSRLDEQLADNPWLQHPTLDDFVAHRMEGKTPGTVFPTPAWPPDGPRPGKPEK
ncbi:MAG: MBL fold metallo-hydrolase [Alphaproteobacteria bacterium]|jgi:glyoxylase-like metal-dependent hydrolase (beta-lactamase superfamily II)|nr:MBL fold metallo-hydrolase [Alphaproteobacteria bacterium]MDP6564259.1 MBL fold metallo-hydrolase [Alphaproteobacteria bacterium]MDP6815218.1 MBL fold metallo-hydrolase [Alphaproteobacteria bacterium]